MFSAYLRGIETVKYFFQPIRLLHVFSLPTRNWNGEIFFSADKTVACFQPTYEELKPHHSNFSCQPISFSAYLRGIETSKYFLHPLFQDICFQPTYEELKLKLEKMAYLYFKGFSAYLRGIETRPCCIILCDLELFSAYLRGIETRFIFSSLCYKFISFQPTYEELKLIYRRNRQIKTIGFQPTYEELKPPNFSFPISAHFCFQPTYEELKLDIPVGHFLPSPGFQPTYEELKPVLLKIQKRRAEKVFSLPTRNWNWYWARRISSYTSSFQPTYEELKPAATSYLSASGWSFQPTYEELKLAHSFKRCFSSLKVFSLPTRNWNTIWLWFTFWIVTFSAYLREIETNRFWITTRSLPRFQPTYEELKRIFNWTRDWVK